MMQVAAAAASSPPRKDWRATALVAAVALLLLIHFLPSPPPLQTAGGPVALTATGKTCLAIMAFAVTAWVSETLPFAVTSLLIVLADPRVRHRGLSRRDPRRLRRSDHHVLHRCPVVVGGVHALRPGHAPGLPDPAACRHADGSRAAGRAGRGRVHLVVDHRHGGGGHAAAARGGSAARRGAAARAQQLWPGVDDCHGVWPADWRHRHARWNRGEPGRHQPS